MPKCKGGSLAVGTYVQRGSAPPPPITGKGGGVMFATPFYVSVKEGGSLSGARYLDEPKPCVLTAVALEVRSEATSILLGIAPSCNQGCQIMG